MDRIVLSRVAALFVLLGLLTITIPATFAAAPVPASPTTVKRVATMTLDCVHMDSKARKYADAHHYCDNVKKQKNGIVVLTSTVVGSCGSSTLYIYQGYASGIARFYEAATSSVGAIVYVQRQISWTNYSTGRGSYQNDGFAASGDWLNQENFNTNTGLVAGSMSGQAFLIWGGTCTIDYPTDSTQIS